VAIDQTLAQAFKLHQAGRLAEAETLYRQVLAEEPQHPEALHLLGLVAHKTGRIDLAADLIRRSISLTPQIADFHVNLGIVLASQRRFDEATLEYRQALALKPESAEANYNLGIALSEMGRTGEALAAFQSAVALKPGLADAHHRIALILLDAGKPDEATLACRRAVLANPNLAEAYNTLGNALHKLGQSDNALDAYARGLKIRPDLAELHQNIGLVLANADRKIEAEVSFRRALELKPDYAKALNGLALILMEKDQLDEAEVLLQRAAGIDPANVDILNNLGRVFKSTWRGAEDLQIRRQISALKPDDPAAHSAMIYTMAWNPQFNPTTMFEESRRWDQRHAKPFRNLKRPRENNPDPERRLRIGYVSGDFWLHSVSYFFRPLLHHHDRREFEIICFSDVARPDAVTDLIRTDAHVWHEIHGQSDESVAELIRTNRIDILVDLSGHSVQNRLMVFARQVAPVQISYLGYPAGTGLSVIDYRMTDIYSDPPGKTEKLHTEELLRLPTTNWCYMPIAGAPEVGRSPAATGKSICFGSFNHLAKVTPWMIGVWSKILQAVPDSRLLLKSPGLGTASVRRKISELFASHGVDSARIDFAGREPNIYSHLEMYHRVDIALDTFPYHGTTTTCESLWMGVPVVTLAGEVHISRVGVSLLTNVGLPELIARNEDEYVSIAATLAADMSRLMELRRDLRDQMKISPLMDAPRFARNVESAYRDVWRRWCAPAQMR
jgi:predicted O-linked N-acetylglucosamine transferase (SPINDLY family)